MALAVMDNICSVLMRILDVRLFVLLSVLFHPKTGIVKLIDVGEFEGKTNFTAFLCPATKSGGVLCYTLRTFECLSVRLSIRPSVSG